MRYLDELRELKFPNHLYAIFGSGPMAIRDIRKNANIDIIVMPYLWHKLEQKHKPYKKGAIKIGNIDIFNHWSGFDDISELIITADSIDCVRYVSLNHVIKWKLEKGTLKDLRDIELIRNYLSKRSF